MILLIPSSYLLLSIYSEVILFASTVHRQLASRPKVAHTVNNADDSISKLVHLAYAIHLRVYEMSSNVATIIIFSILSKVESIR